MFVYRALREEREGRLPLRDAVEKRPISLIDKESAFKYVEIDEVRFHKQNATSDFATKTVFKGNRFSFTGCRKHWTWRSKKILWSSPSYE